MAFNYEGGYVWVLLDKYREIQGVYADEKDCLADRDYLGSSYSVEQWAVDFQTVAVEP